MEPGKTKYSLSVKPEAEPTQSTENSQIAEEKPPCKPYRPTGWIVVLCILGFPLVIGNIVSYVYGNGLYAAPGVLGVVLIIFGCKNVIEYLSDKKKYSEYIAQHQTEEVYVPEDKAPRQTSKSVGWIVASSILALFCCVLVFFLFKQEEQLQSAKEESAYWEKYYSEVAMKLYETEAALAESENVRELHNQAIAKWSGQYYEAKELLTFYEREVRVYTKNGEYYHRYGCPAMEIFADAYVVATGKEPSRYKPCPACIFVSDELPWMPSYMK